MYRESRMSWSRRPDSTLQSRFRLQWYLVFITFLGTRFHNRAPLDVFANRHTAYFGACLCAPPVQSGEKTTRESLLGGTGISTNDLSTRTEIFLGKFLSQYAPNAQSNTRDGYHTCPSENVKCSTGLIRD
jgi:hypothetical protein